MPTRRAEAEGLAELNRGAEEAWVAAQPRHPGLSVEVLPEVDSTNAHALAQGRRGLTDPLVVVAWHQTAGRGRLGRAWQSRPGDSLTLSVGLSMNLMQVPQGASALSLAVGVAVAEALEDARPSAAPAHPVIRLKWPNDLWVDDRKLGGILIEAIPAPGLPATHRWVVAGVGVNMRDAQALDHAAHSTDLAQTGLARRPGSALACLAPALLDALRRFEGEGFAPLRSRYDQRDALKGRPVTLWRHAAGQQGPALSGSSAPDATGLAAGVDVDGALLIQPHGEGRSLPFQRWTVGEVSVRPHPL